MIEQVIEGKWDELVQREDLRGHRVRITVLEPLPTQHLTESSTPEERQRWLAAFKAWVESHEPVGHFVDDSRESIYDATIGNPR
jgi:hypothetical protein